ncbi:MAG: hypothetical protein GY757_20280 [bacterium]|nr:hypothetical protein [bacterium]
MKKCYLIVSLLLLTTLIAAAGPGKVTVLPDLLKPHSIDVSGNDMIITDGAVVSIYQKENLRIKKKFGKAGAGPQEFKLTSFIEKGLVIDVQPHHLLITSIGKLSMYGRDGSFIKEMKAGHNYFGNRFLALKKGFVGICTEMTEENYYISLNLHDEQLNRGKQIWKWSNPYQRGKGTDVLNQPIIFRKAGDKILVAGGMEFKIHVFDSTGNALAPITLETEKIEIPDSVKKGVINYYKTDPSTRHVFKHIVPIHFPEFYPAVKSFVAADQKIYVITHKQKDELYECYVLDMKGTLLKQTYIPLVHVNPLQASPFTINGGKLYQLVDNEETEAWELRIHPIL